MKNRSKEDAYLTNAVGISSAENMHNLNIQDEYWKSNIVGIGLVDYMVLQDN